MNAPSATWEPQLLERRHELAELDTVMRAARGGVGGTVLIEAAAGLGKTRLLQRLRARAPRLAVRVLSARGSELEREFPYGLVRQLLEPVLVSLGAPERAVLMEGAASGARAVLGSHRERVGSPDSVPGESSFSALYGLFWLTANLSQTGPLLLAVDDAHWGDRPSLEFLRFLITRLEGLPIMVAIGTRPPDPGSPLAPLWSDPSTVVVRPGPLGPDSVAELLAGVLGSPPDTAFSSACHAVTGGNPFLLTELSRKLADECVQPNAASASILRGLVPETILRAVLHRLAALDAPARDLARALAILGDGCEQRRVAALAGLGPDVAAHAADALRGVEILDGEPPLRFAHPLVRNAIYSDVPAGARSREHERAAVLLAAEGLPAERIAMHLLEVDPAGDASVVRTLRDAAQAALDKGAPQSAIAYLHRALREPPPTDARGDLFELLNTVAQRAWDKSALIPFQEEAIETLTADPARLMRAAGGLAMFLLAVGRGDDGKRVLESGIAVAEEAGDLGVAVALEGQLIWFAQLPPAEARERLARYDGRLDEGTEEQRLAFALHSWWSNLAGGPASDAAHLARCALAGGRTAADQLDAASFGNTAVVLIRADELDAAEHAAECMIAAGTERGALDALNVGWFVRGSASLRRGDLRRAEADARQVRCQTRELPQFGFFVALQQLSSRLLVDVLVEQDELEAADHEVAASGMIGRIPEGYPLWPALFSRGKLRLAQGRAREAADDMLDLRGRMATWGMSGMPGLPVGAYASRALALLGEHEEALALAEEQLVNARRWGAPSAIAEALAALGVVTGGGRGVELLTEAARILESTPMRLLHAATLTDLGALVRRERRPCDAREPLRAGLDLARRCRAVAVARRAAHELEATGEKVPRYTPIGVDTLTASELRVAQMAARGMTNREIAASLFITVKTVESHLRAAYDKLGVRSRRKLATALASAGEEPPLERGIGVPEPVAT